MNQQHQPQAERLDELLTLLANQHCRDTLSYFRDAPNDIVSVEELANELSTEDQRETERVTIQLHHSVLPRLADTTAVDYDARSHTVRYRGHSGLETLLDNIKESYPATKH